MLSLFIYLFIYLGVQRLCSAIGYDFFFPHVNKVISYWMHSLRPRFSILSLTWELFCCGKHLCRRGKMQKMQPPLIFCFRSHACRIICPCIPCFAKRCFSLCYSQCNNRDGSQQHNFLCPTTWMQVQLVDTLTRILKVLIQLGIWLMWPVLPLFMCSEKDSARLFPLNQSFAAFAQIHTRFSPPKLIFLCVLLQFQVWGDLVFELSSGPMCSILCDKMCAVNRGNRNLSFHFYLKETAVKWDKWRSCIHVRSNQKSCGVSRNFLTSLLIWLVPRGSLLVSFAWGLNPLLVGIYRQDK